MERLAPPCFSTLREKLDSLNIEAGIFDLDDTILKTQQQFARFFGEYFSIVSFETAIPLDSLWQAFDHAMPIAHRGPNSVSPAVWTDVIALMADEIGQADTLIKHLPLLEEIYRQAPPYIEGAEPVLKALKKVGLKTALVTHANWDWTIVKLTHPKLRLLDYFDYVWIADEKRPKSAADWQQAIAALEVLPQHCLGVGDHYERDIGAMLSLGVNRLVCIKPAWKLHVQGDLPPDVAQVDSIAQLLDIIWDLKPQKIPNFTHL